MHGGMVRVEGHTDGGVLQGVALLGEHTGSSGGRSDDGLDFIGVDDTGQVSVGHTGAGQVEARLELGSLVVGAEDGVQLLEGTLGPDQESAQMATRSQVQQVQVVHVGQLDTGQVAESTVDALRHVVDDQRSTSLGVSSVSGLANTASDLLGVSGLLHIGGGTDSGQDSLGILGLGHRVQGVRDDQGQLRHVVDAVAAGSNQGRDSSSGQSRSNSVASLVDTDLAVPSSPDLGGAEHATTTAHVAEGTLSGAGGSTTGHTGNTRHSATSAPRLGRGLVTRLEGHGVGLSGVLGHQRVDVVDHIGADGGSEDCGESHCANRGISVLGVINRHNRTAHPSLLFVKMNSDEHKVATHTHKTTHTKPHTQANTQTRTHKTHTQNSHNKMSHPPSIQKSARLPATHTNLSSAVVNS
jgi:hypothetical protein